jgi:uncharacterized membrane protein YqjE
VPTPKTAVTIVTMNALLGCGLGVLFTALLVASAQGPAQHVFHGTDAAVPLLCLIANMSALLATAVVGTSWSLTEGRASRPERPGGGRRALVAIRVVRRER